MATKECELHDVFCENVRARRGRLNLTQKEVAARLGISSPRYCQIERGDNIPSLDLVERVAAALGTSAQSLLRLSRP